MAGTSSTPIIKLYKRFNDTLNQPAWEIIYFVTSAGAVKETENRMFVRSADSFNKGNWAASTAYAVGNFVTYNNHLYYCKTAHTSTSSFEASKWTEIDLSKPATDSLSGHMSAGQASKLAGISTGANKVTATEKSGNIVIDDNTTIQIIPDNVVTGTGTNTKLVLWNGTNTVTTGPGYSQTSGSLSLVQADENGKIDIEWLPDSIIGSLKYRGTWNAQDGSVDIASYSTATKGDYFIARVAGSRAPLELDNPEQWTTQPWAAGTYVYTGSGSSRRDFVSKVAITSSTQNVEPGVTSGWQNYWKEITNVYYEIGDWAVFNGVYWDEIDNQTKVVSVNDQQGAIYTYKGTWASGTAYHRGDIVFYETLGALMICVVNAGSTSSTSYVANQWKVMSAPLVDYIDESGSDSSNKGLSQLGARQVASDFQTVRNYIVAPITPFFVRYSGVNSTSHGAPVALSATTSDISAAFNPSTPNWGVLYEYFRVSVFNFELAAGGASGTPGLGVEGMFTASDLAANNTGLPMSSKLFSYFPSGLGTYDDNNIDAFKVECYGAKGSAAECTLKITLYTTTAREYELVIHASNAGSNTTYTTQGWSPKTKTFITANSTATAALTNLVDGDIVLESVN